MYHVSILIEKVHELLKMKIRQLNFGMYLQVLCSTDPEKLDQVHFPVKC